MGRFITFTGRQKRRRVIRNKISGTTERPRLSVYRSLSHLYAQVIDDLEGKTLVSASTNSSSLKEALKKNCGNVKAAGVLGAAIAELCKKKNITKVVFDRSGYRYHGRVKALAEAARKGGLQF